MSDASVLVPRERLERWLENFAERHGETTLEVRAGALHGLAADGSAFEARPPFGQEYDGPPNPSTFGVACHAPPQWGILLVRKGGFAVARLEGDRIADAKVGRRHVQGRTKAGGQSQQRFARRQNQARQAFEAAADHAARILGDVSLLVVGGDRQALDEVLSDRRLAGPVVVPPFLAVPDPRRSVLEQAVTDASSVGVSVTNAE